MPVKVKVVIHDDHMIVEVSGENGQVVKTKYSRIEELYMLDLRTEAIAARKAEKALQEYQKGWRCAQSPTGYCEYKGGDEDSCDHCGEPYERK